MRFWICFLLLAAIIPDNLARSQDGRHEQVRPSNGTKIALWEHGAPGFENKQGEEEVAKDWWVANIHNPSITAYFPESAKANGTSVLICPGGGHRELVFGPEGVEAAQFLNSLGVTAFALKYRLGNDKLIEGEKPYRAEVHARQDAMRAMRLIRSRSKEWGLADQSIGVMGFSAGGQVAHMVVFDEGTSNESNSDTLDKVSAKPNFSIIIYPGGGFIPETIPTDTPPAFLLATMEDRGPASILLKLAEKYRGANVPVELHLFAKGAHGYNMGNRSKLKTIRGWPERLKDWMSDSGYLGEAVETP